MRKYLVVIVVVHILLSLIISQLVLPGLLDDVNMKIGYDEYDELGWNLANGRGFRSDHGELSVVRGPSYPALLATVYALSGGRNYWIVQVLQALMSAGSLLLVYRIAREIFNEKVAITAAIIFCVHPLSLWFSARIYLETWFTLFITGIVYLVLLTARRLRWKRVIAVGVLFGATLYIKTIALFLIPVMILFFLISGISWRRTLAVVLTILIISLIIVAPWTARNYIVTEGRLVPVHASMALPLLGGHYLALAFPESPLSADKGIHDSFAAFPVMTQGLGFERSEYPYRSLREELTVDKAAVAFMINYYLENPWMAVQNSIIRFAQFWYLGHRPYFGVLMIFISLVSLSLAVITMKHHWRNRAAWLPVIIILVYSGIHALIIGLARLQVMIIPMISIVMAPAVLMIIEKIRSGPDHSEIEKGNTQ